MSISTRNVVGYCLQADGVATLRETLVQRIEIGSGVEFPLLHTVSARMAHVELHIVKFTPCMVSYDVYYTARGTHAEVNLALAKENPFGPMWKGDIVVLRRSGGRRQYEDMVQGDKELALRAAVFAVGFAAAPENENVDSLISALSSVCLSPVV